MFRITILYGAIREGRLSIRAAKAIKSALEASGKAEITFIDIKDYNLPVMEARLKDMENPPDGLLDISQKLATADGIVFVTPEYNNSYSGAMKNAVDYFTKEWSKKPIGIVCGSDGKQGGLNASNLLQLLVLAIGAFPMPYKLLVPELQLALDEEGQPKNEALSKSIQHFVKEYLWFVDAISTQVQKGK
ncbi:NADPH-dependent FMN reductase [Polluticoccus soli]|uniref:NADPH-dependent FMN reductase n=1 Tax=Polluticoccus soli TaxID=3034150 RepID=UPI0023E2ED51|nr:NAD(P)H-dependent oxidoreductase [Flavipsychrobacter sp. JY13-12]